MPKLSISFSEKKQPKNDGYAYHIRGTNTIIMQWPIAYIHIPIDSNTIHIFMGVRVPSCIFNYQFPFALQIHNLSNSNGKSERERKQKQSIIQTKESEHT